MEKKFQIGEIASSLIYQRLLLDIGKTRKFYILVKNVKTIIVIIQLKI